MMRFLGVFCPTRPSETYTAERFQLLVFCHKLQKWRLIFQFFHRLVADVCRKSSIIMPYWNFQGHVWTQQPAPEPVFESLFVLQAASCSFVRPCLLSRLERRCQSGISTQYRFGPFSRFYYEQLVVQHSHSVLYLCRPCDWVSFWHDSRAVCGPDNMRPHLRRLQRPGVSAGIHADMNFSTAQTMILSSHAHTLCPIWLTEGVSVVIDTYMIRSVRCWLYGVDTYIATRWFKRGQRECCWHGHSYLVTQLLFSHSTVRKSSWLGAALYRYSLVRSFLIAGELPESESTALFA